jgi:hypothetical protein
MQTNWLTVTSMTRQGFRVQAAVQLLEAKEQVGAAPASHNAAASHMLHQVAARPASAITSVAQVATIGSAGHLCQGQC